MIGTSNVNIELDGNTYEMEIQMLGRSLSVNQGYIGGLTFGVRMKKITVIYNVLKLCNLIPQVCKMDLKGKAARLAVIDYLRAQAESRMNFLTVLTAYGDQCPNVTPA